MSHSQQPCLICAQQQYTLYELSPLTQHCFVSSDGRPVQGQKNLALCQGCGLVLGQAADIPAGFYASYDESAPQDPCIFTPQGLRSRSRVLVELLIQQLALPDQGNILDIGCNHGFFLGEFHQQWPEWELYGFEIADRPSAIREQILPSEHFVTGQLSKFTHQFDLITLGHVFEHVTDLPVLARELVRLLRPAGAILIEVPHYPDNFIDLTIYDHVLHFSRQTLLNMMQTLGFAVGFCSTEVIHKEISLICRPAGHAAVTAYTADTQAPARIAAGLQQLEQLHSLIVQVRAQHANGRPIAILGTAIGAALAASQLGDCLDCFLDENPKRQHSQFLGKPVYTVQQAPRDALCLLPFPPQTAATIAARLTRQRPDLNCQFST